MNGKTRLGEVRLCSTCSSLQLSRQDFEQPPYQPEEKYHQTIRRGTLTQLRERGGTCGLCRLVLHALQRNDQVWGYKGVRSDDTKWRLEWQRNAEYDPAEDEAENLYGSGLYPQLEDPDSQTSYCIQLVDDPATRVLLRGRSVHKRIDPEMIRNWITACKRSHAAACNKPSSLRSLHNRLLCIDVQQDCLGHINSDDTYAALSYVWGAKAQPQTTNANFKDYCKHGAFKTVTLPKTIRDTIEVAKALGYRWLWVDSLCIVQDQQEEKMRLINSMDAVYGNADLTIVAASGETVHSGLCGWDAGNQSGRKLEIATLGPDFRIGILPAFADELLSCHHAKRGWTYQEGALSCRCLVFLNGFVYFYCQSAVWREDVMAETEKFRPIEGAGTLGRARSEWHLRRYSQIIDAYTSRDLTFEADIERAFAGLKANLAASMDNTFIWYGLPACAFDWAMLWSSSYDESVQRRYGFPTWSWMGYKSRALLATDHWSDFDEEWLRQRTWIDWHIIKNGEVISVWDPERDGTKLRSPDVHSEATPAINSSVKSVAGPEILPKAQLEDFSAASAEGESNNNASVYLHEDSHADAALGSILVGASLRTDLEGKDKEDDQSDPHSSSQSDVNSAEDDEFCPQYGKPKDNNLYGRDNAGHLDFLRKYRVAGRAQPSVKLPEPSNYPYLMFSTLHCSYYTALPMWKERPYSYLAKSPKIIALKDVNDNVCGLVQYDGPSEVSTVEVLILSYSAPGTTSAFPIERLNGNQDGFSALPKAEVEDSEEILGEMHTWNLLNILLVTSRDRTTTVKERIGIGVLYKHAIEASITPARWAQVILG
ncbi:MAG: hypothetical protein M1822_005761 [Bathelium mastoideum]|nr:MAG: hypothetical protein M1822_005761 [Bathelium mastoideum]